MAILNYGNQFKYSGKGYIDSKMAPVESVDKLETNVSVLSSQYMPGMKVTVLNDGEFGAVEYFLNDDYEWKRVVDLDKLTLSLDKGDYDSDPKTEYFLQLHYTNTNGELIALGETLDLSILLEDVEARIETLENKEDVPTVEDTNTFVEKADIVTEKDEENGLFVKFTYNNGESFFLDITDLEPKTYANGVGILIGEDNVVSVDEAWFNTWFDEKIAELSNKLDALASQVEESFTSLSNTINTISNKVDAHDNEISSIKTNLTAALTQISENKVTIENVKTTAEEAKTKSEENAVAIISLAEKLAKIRGVDFVKAGENITIVENEDGSITLSATVTETDVDLKPIEDRLDTVEGNVTELANRLTETEEGLSLVDGKLGEMEGTVSQHTSDIASLQEAIKSFNPEGEGLSGDNVTIKANENGALSVMISEAENNILKRNNDGIFAQGIEIILGDEQLNEADN